MEVGLLLPELGHSCGAQLGASTRFAFLPPHLVDSLRPPSAEGWGYKAALSGFLDEWAGGSPAP